MKRDPCRWWCSVILLGQQMATRGGETRPAKIGRIHVAGDAGKCEPSCSVLLQWLLLVAVVAEP